MMGESTGSEAADPKVDGFAGHAPKARVERVSLVRIRTDDPRQVRLRLRDPELEELAESVKKHGILNLPLLDRDGTAYRVIAGSRRVEAARRAGLREIEARVLESVADAEAVALGLSENLVRVNLTRYEVALGCHRLSRELNWPYARIAEALGVHPKKIQRHVRFVEKATSELTDAVDRGALAYSQALPLLRLEGADQVTLTREAVERHLKRQDIEKRVRTILRQKRGQKHSDIERELGVLPAYARAWKLKGGKGFTIEIPFSSVEEGRTRMQEARECLGGPAKAPEPRSVLKPVRRGARKPRPRRVRARSK